MTVAEAWAKVANAFRELEKAQTEYRDLLAKDSNAEILADCELRQLQHRVAEIFGVTRSMLISRSRERRCAFARHVAIYLALEISKSSLKQVGYAFGLKDHVSVIHARKHIENELSISPDLRVKLAQLRNEFKPQKEAS